MALFAMAYHEIKQLIPAKRGYGLVSEVQVPRRKQEQMQQLCLWAWSLGQMLWSIEQIY